jgi:hypothetical protein
LGAFLLTFLSVSVRIYISLVIASKFLSAQVDH